MIICISANPALDQRVWLQRLNLGAVNRVNRAVSTFGGKAAHVAMAVQSLGEDAIWVGFLGGATGSYLERELELLKLDSEIIQVASATRINQEIVEDDGTVTEVLEPGAYIDEAESRRMLSLCARLFSRYKSDAYVVISGSLPPGLSASFYVEIMEAARSRGCFVFVDTSGQALEGCVAAVPDLVKPNRHEAATLLHCAIEDKRGAFAAAEQLLELGAHGVALSLGVEGLVYAANHEREKLLVSSPPITGQSAVGCGDTTLAGLVVAKVRHMNFRDSALLAVACGAANCLAPSPGMIEMDTVNAIMKEITVETEIGIGH